MDYILPPFVRLRLPPSLAALLLLLWRLLPRGARSGGLLLPRRHHVAAGGVGSRHGPGPGGGGGAAGRLAGVPVEGESVRAGAAARRTPGGVHSQVRRGSSRRPLRALPYLLLLLALLLPSVVGALPHGQPPLGVRGRFGVVVFGQFS